MYLGGNHPSDSKLAQILARLKQNAELIRQEREEINRCVRYAEEILRQASRLHP